MDGPRNYHTEWSKSDREGEISHGIPYMWKLKRNDTNELTKQKETYRKWAYGCQLEGVVREFEMDMYTLLYLKWVTNRDLLCSTWNSARGNVAAWLGGEFGGEWIHVYVWLSPFAVHLKLSHCLSAILQYKIKSLKKEIENHPFIDINWSRPGLSIDV